MDHETQNYEQSGRLQVSRRLLVVLGKLAVFGLTLYYVREAILNAQKTTIFSLETLQSIWETHQIGIWAAVMLLPMNWGLEALKWQYLSGKLEKISFWAAYRAVLVGLTLGFVTPNRVGDYAGRILTLYRTDRADAIGAILLGRLCQLFATLLVGSGGLAYFVFGYYIPLSSAVGLSLLFMLVLINGLGLGLLFSFKATVGVMGRVPLLKRWVHYFAVIGTFSPPELRWVLLVSGARYLVFVLQFICLLWAFGIQLSGQEFLWGAAATFLMKSAVPSLNALADIGMRELSAMHFFGLMGQEPLLVLGASLSLWILNIALPSALGLLFVVPLKLSRPQ